MQVAAESAMVGDTKPKTRRVGRPTGGRRKASLFPSPSMAELAPDFPPRNTHMQLNFTSYEELKSLHHALCEARFHPEPTYRSLQGDSATAATAEKVYDLLIQHAPSDTERENWQQHRMLSPHSPLMPVVENRARKLVADSSLSRSEREGALKIFILPFRIADHHLEDLFERVGQRRPTLW